MKDADTKQAVIRARNCLKDALEASQRATDPNQAVRLLLRGIVEATIEVIPEDGGPG